MFIFCERHEKRKKKREIKFCFLISNACFISYLKEALFQRVFSLPNIQLLVVSVPLPLLLWHDIYLSTSGLPLYNHPKKKETIKKEKKNG
jgi:hypothetical protein